VQRYLPHPVFVLLVGRSTGPACDLADTWEFKTEGHFTSTHEYYSHQGSNGSFGRAHVDRNAGTAGPLGLNPGGFASLNGWVGKRAKDLVSRTDSSQQCGSDSH
jgi:hypothetical protein